METSTAQESKKDKTIPQLNEQYYRGLLYRTCPYRRLMKAIIKRAIIDLGAYGYVGRSAKKWLFLDNEKRDFSFAYCCEQLGYNIDVLRRAIRENRDDVLERFRFST